MRWPSHAVLWIVNVCENESYVLCDTMTQMQNEDSDYGDLPRSRKQLKDLPRSSLMENEACDILAYFSL